MIHVMLIPKMEPAIRRKFLISSNIGWFHLHCFEFPFNLLKFSLTKKTDTKNSWATLLNFNSWMITFTVVHTVVQKKNLALGNLAKLVLWSILSFKNWLLFLFYFLHWQKMGLSNFIIMSYGYFPTRNGLKLSKISKLFWHFERIFWLFPTTKLSKFSTLDHF